MTSGKKRDEDTLDTQENVARVVTSRSGFGVVLAGLVVAWLVLRWIRHG